jgi:hypothetical protein
LKKKLHDQTIDSNKIISIFTEIGGNGKRFLNQRTVHQIPAISTGEREVSTQSQSEKASTERTSPLFSNEIDT